MTDYPRNNGAGALSPEEALRRERDRARRYLDIVGSIVVVLDREGCVTLINRMGCEVLGRSEDEILGCSWFDTFIPEQQREDVKKVFMRLMNGEGEPLDAFENTLVSRHEGERLVAWRNTVLLDDDGHITGTLSSGQDITRQRRMEAALRQSERLEAAGALAETVSQNFNNVLNAIGGYASFLVDSLIPDTRAHRNAQRIVDATRHATELTRRLMNIARASSSPEALDVRPTALSDVLRRTLELLEHVFTARNVTVEVKHIDGMPRVEADADQLIDILMSILTNSAEAMPRGGSITIDTLERRINHPRTNPNARGGVFVGLRLRDSGTGMSRSVMQRIFEPFFTTKPSSESFGLGLPVAQSITQAMGGWIDVGSREGRGTVFRVFLHKAEKAPAGDAPRALPPQQVLLIDDTPEDLALMRAALENEGHTVHAVTDSREALTVFRQRRDGIGCAVVDFLMEGPDGRSLLEHLLQLQADAPIVVTSGFSRDYVRNRVGFGPWTFLQKPFSHEQLVALLNETLRPAKQGGR